VIPKTLDVSSGRRADLVGGSAVDKTTPLTPRELMAADIEQRERARKWVTESTSNTTMVEPNTTDMAPVRSKAVKKAADKAKSMSKESAQSLTNQNAIASQYPPIIDESVSSTVGLGRALVSGALGKRNEDPKIFEATVDLQECSEVLHSTRRKAKAPVSAPPPNSTESDVDVEEHDEVCMSHSTTDLGVNIVLPGSGQELVAERMDVDDVREGMNEIGDKCIKETVAEEMCTAISEPSFPDTPTAPGSVETPVLQRSESTVKEKSARVPSQKRAAGDSVAEIASTTGKAKEMRPEERRRILRDVDAAELLREELARTNPKLASVSAFLGVVCGDRHNTGMDKMISGIAAAEELTEGSTQNSGKDLRQEQRYVELQRPDRTSDVQSLLTEELFKGKPVEAVTTAYEKEACDADKIEGLTIGQNVETEGHGAIISEQELSRVQEGELTKTLEPTAGEVEVETDMEVFEESEIVISEDVEMSNAESEDESSSSGSTIDSSGSSESEDSTVSTRSRKDRPTDLQNVNHLLQPRRNFFVTPRKEFRVGGGCQVHLPVAVGTDGTTNSTDAPANARSPLDAASYVFVAPETTGVQTKTEAVIVETIRAVSTNTAIFKASTTSDTTEAVEMNLGNENVNLAAEADVGATTTTAVANHEGDVRRDATVEPIEMCRIVTTSQNLAQRDVAAAAGMTAVAPTVPTDGQANMMRPYVADGWTRDAHMVEGIFQIIEGMEPPWVTMNVLDTAVVRFPNIDPETLRLAIMTVMITQRRCVVRLTRAGLRLGPRTDRDGNAFVELDLDYADRYIMSH